MFTGIITDLGRVRSLETKRGRETRLVIETSYDTAEIAIGASIACSGACLTVVEKGPGWFAVDVSAETLSRTSLGTWKEGTKVNLERALRMGDELGGHLVLGHVDGVARLVVATPEGESSRLVIEAPAALRRFTAEKGSVALDGVSLTINEVGPTSFGVNIIPHTQRETSLGGLKPGDALNLEIDLLARYVARLAEAK
ncbi:MAG: riboflavin synthase [Alphaproteobacteria bacterium]|nr:riboflavin synthase [Alphaproteobacteria bacterium]